MAGMMQLLKQMLVHAFVPHAPIEAFNKAIMDRLTWGDVGPVDLAVFLPTSGSYSTSVLCRCHGPSDRDNPASQRSYVARGPRVRRQRRIDDSRQTFPAEVTDLIQYPEPMAAGQTVWHKLERPPLFGPRGIAIDALVPTARLRQPHLRTVTPSSR